MRSFWWLLTMASLGWYLTVTFYIAFRGALDIRQMLARLKSGTGPKSDPDTVD